MEKPFFLKQPPKRILVVTLRFLGDTLLTTAFINALKHAYPAAEIDVLLYKNTLGMMEGNSAIANCITCEPKSNWQGYKQLFKQLFRQYDLAISTQTGDRPTLYSFLAAPIRIGFVPHPSKKGGLKRYFFQKSLIFDETKTHTVLELLRLCSLLNIKPVYQLTPPFTKKTFSLTEKPYVVMHVLPQWRYKQWPRENWIALANFLDQHSLQIILSGSPDPKEQQYLNDIQAKMPQNTLNIAGKVSLAQLATVIKK
ncbi:MAG: glycosyltransferase family 9 protein, partial [Methylococcales bacterium]|nr:glycosyltransferase family 9 protein [Methylococcales bacterium]